MKCAGDEADSRVEKIEGIKKSLDKTLGVCMFVENEDGVFIPSRETGFLNLILGKPQKLSHKAGFLHKF